ncbi:capreomycin N-acetyltransferase CpaA [Paenibacillus lautus]|uniref:capreomycin N-acetyltransferase CpaA n=1 Tax=Paenibacillus lautus TaxID=1401 RepID=UPI002DB6B45D|nr:capreomycin N-acetyltransferase CpaA [Paenibacillus lautus]MEC0203741.1 capreomycin N-acetyltransferase CpaA [Paenibacillus lautus]
MPLRITTMTESFADQIMEWNYEPPYDFYNSEPDEEFRKELLECSYYAILDEKGQLFGFCCTGSSAQIPIAIPLGAYDEDLLDFGLGMNPESTGQGRGKEFLSFVLSSIAEIHNRTSYRLTVAKFNERAIRLYTQLGFSEVTSFDHGGTTFITMVKMPVSVK